MDHHEDGFTLIELIVVVTIIGILGAIAIPGFLRERERGLRAAVQSDLRHLAIEAETFYVGVGTFDGFEADSVFTNFVGSPGVTLTIDPADTTPTSFCVEASHSTLPAGETWSYRNDRGPQLVDIGC